MLVQPRRLVTGRIRWRITFAAFKHRNYQLFFGGQLVSLVGTWMQTVAEGWLAYQLTNSAFALGAIRFFHTIPITLFSLLAGAVADRSEKRRILIATQALSMVLAAALAALAYAGIIRPWHIALLGFFLGLASAFDIPARQSFVVEMVGKEDLMNAIALNSSMFNGARIVGPAIAGLLLGPIGAAGCFLINAFSFLAVIGGYAAMDFPKPAQKPPSISLKAATLEAVRYVLGDRVLRAALSLVSVVSMFGWPYSVLMPIFARDVLHAGAAGYGYLMAANGVGAFFGAMTLASIGNYPHKRRLVFGGLFGFCGMLLLFAISKIFWLSALALAGTGYFMIIFFATANTVVQLRVPDPLRGRVMGIYSLCFLGLSPFGSLIAGTLARLTTASLAIVLGIAICILAGFITMWLVPPQAVKESGNQPELPPEA